MWGLQRRGLVLAIYDPAWFIQVTKYLKRRGVRFHYYYSREKVLPGSVVYTDYEYFLKELAGRSDVIMIYDPSRSCRELEKAILIMKFRDLYNLIIIGVDPGIKLSYVALGDEELLFYSEGVLEDLEKDLDYVMSCIPHKQLKVRIGRGPSAIDIAMRVKKKYKVSVELVDERMSTPSVSRLEEIKFLKKRLKGLKPFRYKDVYAAYKIAISEGVEVL